MSESCSGEAKQHQLVQATEFVSDCWLPLNTELLCEVKSKLAADAYNDAADTLLADLKQDCSLFLSCLRELRSKLDSAEVVSGLEGVDFTLLRNLVEELSDDPGTHQLSEATPLQAQRVQHAMISASTAETLAECEELPADLGFTSGVVRQLGLTLIAFNYPHVYARAVAKLADGVDLEQTLSKVLGFSPTMLGISLGRKWGLAPELQLAMGDTQRWTESDVVDDVAARLVKVCQVGEALARANDPEHYPSALSDWTTAENEITAYLGPGGMQKVRARIEHNCASYFKAAPEFFEVRVSHSSALNAVKNSHVERMLSRNQYLSKCPEHIQLAIHQVYAHLVPDQISNESLQLFVSRAVPGAAFTRGCVYLLDPIKMLLIPRLKVGNVDLQSFERVHCSAHYENSDPIATAFGCKIPIMEEGVKRNGAKANFVAGVLGEEDTTGVLYLEFENSASQACENPILYFKALRETLAACLNL